MSATPTAITDIIVPEVLADQITAKFPDYLVVGNAQSGLVEVDTTFPLGAPGTEFKLPFWKKIGEFAALSEGAAMTPGKVAASAEFCEVQRGGAAFEVYDTAELSSKADPVAEISTQIGRRAAEYIDNALVTRVNSSPNTFDQSGVTSDGGVTIAGTLTQNALINGMLTLGDNHSVFRQGGAIVMHSKPFGDLIKLGVIQNQYQGNFDFLKQGQLPSVLGIPVFVSDRVTTASVSSVSYYNTYILGPACLGLFYQRQVMVEFDRDILLQADVIAASVHFAAHLFGWDDKTSAQAAESAKSIHAVVIKSK